MDTILKTASRLYFTFNAVRIICSCEITHHDYEINILTQTVNYILSYKAPRVHIVIFIS